MSTAELTLVLTGKDQASKILHDVEKATGGFGKVLGDVSKIAGGFVLGSGLLSAPSFFLSAAKAAAEDAASVARLEQAVRNTGYAFEDAGHIFDEVIAKGQKLAFSDDQVRDSLALLTAQTGDTEEAERRFALAMDLARGANIDVVAASKLLGKVTDENVNVLARYGIKVEKGAKETELFGAIQAKFGGQAQTFADSTAGKMAQLQIRMGELKETIGAAVLPVMTALANLALTRLIPAIETFSERIGPDVARAFTTAKGALDSLMPTLRDLAEFAQAFANNKDAMIAAGAGILAVIVPAFLAWAAAAGAAAVATIAATAPVIAIGIAVAGLAYGILYLIKNFDEVKAWMRDHWVDIASLILLPFAPILILATDAFGIRSAAITAFRTVVDFVRNLAPEGAAAASALGSAIADAFVSTVKSGINIIREQINKFLTFLNELKINIPSVNIPLVGTVGGGSVGFPNVPLIPQLQAGTPYVPQDMLAYLHRGEAVIPANQNRAGVTVVFQGPVYGMQDFEDQVVEAMRNARRRGAT